MDENDFYYKIWKLVATVFIVLTVAITASCKVTQYNIVQAVEAGASPVEAHCALSSNVASNLCYVEITKN